MFKKALRRSALALIAAVVSTSASAAAQPSSAAYAEWDGKSQLKDGFTYSVTKEIYIDKVVVPKNTRLFAEEGGKILMPVGSEAVVYGEMGAVKGGEIYNSGTVTAREGGKIEIYGDYKASVGSVTDVIGGFTVYNTGSMTMSGAMNLYPGATFLNRKIAKVTQGGAVTVSGKVTNDKYAELDIFGNFVVTVGGSFTSNGSLIVGSGVRLINSGQTLLERGSTLTQGGQIVTTVNGVYIDRTREPDYDSMTAAAIAGQPGTYIVGIDVSVWNGEIDWAAVRASGVEFAMIRAGRGYINDTKPMTVDDMFLRNIKGANDNGINAGVYFYSYAKDVEEIKREARFLTETIRGCNISYPVVLDMEENVDRDKATAMVEAFFKIVMDEGYYPMIYSYKNWFDLNLDSRVLDKYSVWLAELKDTPTYTGSFYMWQYSHTGHVYGINGEVGLNIALRNFASYIKAKKFNNM